MPGFVSSSKVTIFSGFLLAASAISDFELVVVSLFSLSNNGPTSAPLLISFNNLDAKIGSIFRRSKLSRSKAFKAELSRNSDKLELLLLEEEAEVGSADDLPEEVEDTNIEGKGRCGLPRPKVCMESPRASKVTGSCLSFLGKLCTELGIVTLGGVTLALDNGTLGGKLVITVLGGGRGMFTLPQLALVSDNLCMAIVVVFEVIIPSAKLDVIGSIMLLKVGLVVMVISSNGK